jgi:hypothetical protein
VPPLYDVPQLPGKLTVVNGLTTVVVLAVLVDVSVVDMIVVVVGVVVAVLAVVVNVGASGNWKTPTFLLYHGAKINLLSMKTHPEYLLASVVWDEISISLKVCVAMSKIPILPTFTGTKYSLSP